MVLDFLLAIFFPSKTSPSFAVPAGLVCGRTAFRCEAVRAGGAEPWFPALAALRPSHGQHGRLLEFAAAAEAAPGYLGAARGPLCPRLWLGLFIFLSGCRAWRSALAFPPSVQTFLLLQVSLAEAEANRALTGRPLAGLEGGGARPPWAPQGRLAGGGVWAGAGLGCAGRGGSRGFHALGGAEWELGGDPGKPRCFPRRPLSRS